MYTGLNSRIHFIDTFRFARKVVEHTEIHVRTYTFFFGGTSGHTQEQWLKELVSSSFYIWTEVHNMYSVTMAIKYR